MEVAIIGYGKMGREIERLLLGRGHEVVLVVDEDNPLTIGALRASGAQVAVEFTTPQSAFDNVAKCLEAGVAVVCGTTGWLARWDEAVALCRERNGALFYASNYSVGVNLLFRMNEQLARMMSSFPQYSVSITETHHIHKKDAPSGTAITLAEQLGVRSELLGVESETELGVNVINGVPIRSIREGEHPGLHEVEWRSEVDAITLRHESLSRLGLATGAVMAVEFVAGRHGIFSMDDVLGDYNCLKEVK